MTKDSLTMLTTVAWRNIWRNHRRTMVMISAIILGVWAMVFMNAIMRGMVDQMVHGAIYNLTGHIQIHAPEYRDDPAISNSMPSPSASLLEKLKHPRIKAWSTRVRLPAVITSERESLGAMVLGIDPIAEKGLSFITDAISEGRHLTSVNDTGIIIGRKMAERLETKLGRRVVLMAQDPDNNVVSRGFRIIGIFDAELDASEKAFMFIGRETAQKMMVMGNSVSELALITDSYLDLEPLIGELQRAAPALEVLGWETLDPFISQMLGISEGFALVWAIVVFLAMSFGLVNTLLMAVFERTREIGLVQALGMKPRYILLQVLIESLVLLGIGLVLGNLIAWASLAPIMDGWDISFMGDEGLELARMSPVIYPSIAAIDVIYSNVVVVVLGIVASLYPAWKASRYVPIEAITRT